jgi:predicted ester cyclase
MVRTTLVISELRLERHRGIFQGIAPTNRSVEFTALVIYQIHHGKIIESWGEIDLSWLMRQLLTDGAWSTRQQHASSVSMNKIRGLSL